MIHMVRLLIQKSLLGGALAIMLAVFPGVSAFAADDPSATQKPRAVVSKRIYSFGSVIENTNIEHDFIIENRGSGVLQIQNVKPG